MAKHEFGIMKTAPAKSRRYDEYNPEKYNCISVADDYLENVVADFCHIDTYWHTTDIKGKGLEYSGITLIRLNPSKHLPMLSEISQICLSFLS